MFDREDISEKLMECMSAEYIKQNVKLSLENSETYAQKSLFVPTDDRITKNMKGVAVVPYITVMEDDDGRASVLVTNDMLDHYGLSAADMFDAAYKNLDEETVRIRSLTDVITSMTLEGIMGDGADKCIEPENLSGDIGDLYYVTNTSAYKGAMSIFANDTYKKIGKAMGEYYIIPSSVHEVLIVNCDSIEPGFISEIVKSVNGSGIVADNDILSNEVYKYDSKTESVVTLDASGERKRTQDTDLEI